MHSRTMITSFIDIVHWIWDFNNEMFVSLINRFYFHCTHRLLSDLWVWHILKQSKTMSVVFLQILMSFNCHNYKLIVISKIQQKYKQNYYNLFFIGRKLYELRTCAKIQTDNGSAGMMMSWEYDHTISMVHWKQNLVSAKWD